MNVRFIDDKWVENNINNIFPEGQFDRFFASFSIFLQYNRPHKTTFSLLKNKYVFAINNISDFNDESISLGRTDQRISEHIMTLYWHKEINIDDPDDILQVFYKKASDTLRAHAINFIGRNLKEAPNSYVTEEVIERFKKLWNNRYSTAFNSDDRNNFKEELSSFGSWFTVDKFGNEWLLEQLEAVLKITGLVEDDHDVIEKLEQISEEYPMEIITCLELMINNANQSKRYYWLPEIKILLGKVLKSDNKDARSKATDLVHTLGSYGFLELRELL